MSATDDAENVDTKKAKDGPSHGKGVALTIAAGVMLPLLFAFFYVFPAHDPQANDLPVGVVAPAGQAERVAAELTRRDDGLSVSYFADAANARGAISDRDVYGAFVVARAGPSRVLISSAQSEAVANYLSALGGESGFKRIEDVTPLAKGDPLGVTLNVMVLPLVITAILGALLSIQFAPWMSIGGRLAITGVVAILAGFGLVGLVHLLGALPGPFLGEVAVIALGMMSIALTAGGIVRLLGASGTLVAFLLFLMLGNPASGVASAPELLPTPWAQLGGFLPPGALGSALRGTAYFGYAGVVGPVLVLVAWVGVGVGLHLLADRRSARKASRSAVVASASRTAVPA